MPGGEIAKLPLHPFCASLMEQNKSEIKAASSKIYFINPKRDIWVSQQKIQGSERELKCYFIFIKGPLFYHQV